MPKKGDDGMDRNQIICATTTRAIETGVVTADIEEALPPARPRYLNPSFLIPGYVSGKIECPSKGTYWLIASPDGSYETICTYHSDREKVTPLIIDAFVCRIIQYVDYDFLMAAQGKRTDFGDFISMCINYPFSQAWKAYSEGNALDCSGLAVEAMRDSLCGLYKEPALIPDAGAKTLAHIGSSYPYTEVVKTSMRPSAMPDPCKMLRPGDITIVTTGQNVVHTTVFLGRYRAGDTTPYWIWASGSKKKIAIFTHAEYCSSYSGAPAETVVRWNVKGYQP